MRLRKVLGLLALAAAPACGPHHELEQIAANLEVHVEAQERAVKKASSNRASALRAELLGLDAGTAGPGGGEPAMLVAVPEKSIFETDADARLRVRIATLQAEAEQLDRAMNRLVEMDARKQRADAQLKQLEAMVSDAGER